MKTVVKSVALALAILATGATLHAQAPPGAAAGTGSSGRIQFATNVHDFPKVRAGEIVKHSFTFTNTGSGLLEITAVRLSCGCTTAGEWTRRVEPGNTGVIPLQLNTDESWPSGAISKTVEVASTDKVQPSVVLEMKGTVWKPLDVIPQYVALNIVADATASPSSTVRLVNNTDTPLSLSPPQIDNPAFAVELRTNQPGKEYQLVVTAKPPFSSGTMQGRVRLGTSLSTTPEITVLVMANVQPAIVVMPPRIILPAPPLGRRSTPAFTIQNNSTNALTLSEPAFSVAGVGIDIRETAPGRTFVVTLTFPQEFSLAQGKQATFSVKTSHPRFPVIRVPVLRTPYALPPSPGTALDVPTGAAKPAAPISPGPRR